MTRRSGLALLVALAAVVAAALPAMRGGPVYDDVQMHESRLMTRASDVPAVFWRNSADYLAADDAEEPDASTPFTYRPLAMLSLVATEVGSDSMFVHHAVSASLLVLAIVALVLALARLGLDPFVAAVVGTFVAANPAIGETWLFVNGRADLQAFAACAVFAWALACLRSGERARSAPVVAIATAVVAALSKETSLATLVFVALVILATDRGARPGRARVAEAGFVAVSVAVGALLFGRYQSGLRFHGSSAVPVGVDLDVLGTLVARAPRVAALALGSFVSPEARTMRTLAYELVRPAGQLEALGAVAFAGVCGLAVIRRSAPVAIAALAIPATLLPCAFVADSFWLGLDRYVALAILPLLVAIPDVVSPGLPKVPDWVVLVASAFVLVSTAGLFGTARAYADHDAFVERTIATRPLDPTGYVLRGHVAIERRSTPLLNEAAAGIPDVIPYPPLAIAWFRVLAQGERTQEMVDGIERLYATHPGDVQVVAISVDSAIARGDLPLAFRRGRSTFHDRPACRHVLVTFEKLHAVEGLTLATRRTIADFVDETNAHCR